VLFIIRPGPRRGVDYPVPFRSVPFGIEGGDGPGPCPSRPGRPGARSHRTRVVFGVLDPLVRSYRGRDRGGQLHANANDLHVGSSRPKHGSTVNVCPVPSSV
jgi:hypothetical protein